MIDNMNNIGIDFTFIGDNDIKCRDLKGSISIFAADVLRGFEIINRSDNFTLIINSAAEKYVKETFPHFRTVKIGGRLSNVSHYVMGRQLNSRKMKRKCHYNNIIRKNKIEKIWYPWMVPEETDNINCEYVGTCHDLKMRNANSDESCMKMFKQSKGIISISDFIKNQIMQTYQIDEKKITTIPNSLSLAEKNVTAREIENLKGKKFILDVNAYGEEKNTLTMIRAFNRIKDYVACDLVLCGGYGDKQYIKRCRNYILDHGLADRTTMLMGICEEEKNWLFKNCMLFVTPSENEGFGRTPIEAALCGKPVISTRYTALQETTAGRLNYYDNPKDDEELADKIMQILNKPTSVEMLNANRDYFIERYSLESVANKYIDFFKGLSWI